MDKICKNCHFFDRLMMRGEVNHKKLVLHLDMGLCINEFSDHYYEVIQEDHDCSKFQPIEDYDIT